MIIGRLTLENFRNFPNLDLSLNQGFLVFCGDNGAGKTNLLESIYLAATLRRFPESSIGQLIRRGERFFRITLGCVGISESSTQEVFMEARDGSFFHQYKINDAVCARSQFQERLPVISFLPQDLNLLTRSPGNRRRYLNEVLSIISAPYRHARGQYEQALRQRNEILQKLKSGERSEGLDLEIWNEKLAEHGALINAKRADYLEYINLNFSRVHDFLSPELRGINFIYRMSGSRDKEEFLAKLQGLWQEEQVRGATLFGPHRDDLEARFLEEPAVGFVSRGGLRSITLALKILEKEYLEERLDVSPVLLLDDVFSEFDHPHQQKLIEFFQSLPQVFLTTTHLEEVKSFLPATTQIYNISSGTVTPLFPPKADPPLAEK